MILTALILGLGLISTVAPRKHHHHRTGTVPPGTFSGDATFTTPGTGACERTSQEGQLVAAINQEQFGNPKRGRDGIWCGKCAQVNAPDFSTSVIVQIVDRADGAQGHLVLSQTAFSQLASTDEGHLDVEWQAIPCPRNISDLVAMGNQGHGTNDDTSQDGTDSDSSPDSSSGPVEVPSTFGGAGGAPVSDHRGSSRFSGNRRGTFSGHETSDNGQGGTGTDSDFSPDSSPGPGASTFGTGGSPSSDNSGSDRFSGGSRHGSRTGADNSGGQFGGNFDSGRGTSGSRRVSPVTGSDNSGTDAGQGSVGSESDFSNPNSPSDQGSASGFPSSSSNFDSGRNFGSGRHGSRISASGNSWQPRGTDSGNTNGAAPGSGSEQ